jgi:hypothetical protein
VSSGQRCASGNSNNRDKEILPSFPIFLFPSASTTSSSTCALAGVSDTGVLASTALTLDVARLSGEAFAQSYYSKRGDHRPLVLVDIPVPWQMLSQKLHKGTQLRQLSSLFLPLREINRRGASPAALHQSAVGDGAQAGAVHMASTG